ncbi:hypothetical protein PRZ48_013628 [Zasmidium cellare]|uniref:Xylanolytic transcriptional activator regulatory domain-containing protein n=1 Tax=Zasmidium cellare TaxID=395010 RepID=A0ABR0E2D8_ZASCE|nr:hypothetical protein PRZ48_013628 [Zasmidium cellare]
MARSDSAKLMQLNQSSPTAGGGPSDRLGINPSVCRQAWKLTCHPLPPKTAANNASKSATDEADRVKKRRKGVALVACNTCRRRKQALRTYSAEENDRSVLAANRRASTAPTTLNVHKRRDELHHRNLALEAKVSAFKSLFRHLQGQTPEEVQRVIRDVADGRDPAEALARSRNSLSLQVCTEATLARAASPVLQSKLSFFLNVSYPAAFPTYDLRQAESASRGIYSPAQSPQLPSPAQSPQVLPPPDLETGPDRPLPLCDQHLARLDASFWTEVAITNDDLAKTLSVFFKIDHPLFGCFDVDLFIRDLVAKRATICSSLLVSAVSYWASHLYRSTEASLYVSRFRDEALRRLNAATPTERMDFKTVAAATCIHIALLFDGLAKVADDVQASILDMTKTQQLFGDPHDVPTLHGNGDEEADQLRAISHVAWGVFNHTTYEIVLSTIPGNGGALAQDPLTGSIIEHSLPDYMRQTFPAVCQFFLLVNQIALLYDSGPAPHASLRSMKSMADVSPTFGTMIQGFIMLAVNKGYLTLVEARKAKKAFTPVPPSADGKLSLTTPDEGTAQELFRQIRNDHTAGKVLKAMQLRNVPQDVINANEQWLLQQDTTTKLDLPSREALKPLRDTIVSLEALTGLIANSNSSIPRAIPYNALDEVEEEQPLFWIPAQKWTTIEISDWAMSHLVSVFLVFLNPYFRYVEQDLFLQAIRRGKESTYCTPLLVNAILAFASLFSDIDEAFAHPRQLLTRGEHFHDEGMRLWAMENGKTSIANLQALMLLSAESGIRGKDNAGVSLITTAVTLDSIFATTTVSSTPTSQEGRAFRRARNALAWNINHVHATYRLAMSRNAERGDKPVPFNRDVLFVERCKLTRYMWEISNMRAMRTRHGRARLWQTAQDLSQRYRDWLESLPPSIQYSEDIPAGLYEFHSQIRCVSMTLHDEAYALLFETTTPPQDQDPAIPIEDDHLPDKPTIKAALRRHALNSALSAATILRD